VPTPVDRRSVLAGILGGVAVGGATGFVSGRASAARPGALERPGSADLAHRSYAQQGEDLVVEQMFEAQLHAPMRSYVDIGAHDPVVGSNTYLFYRAGVRGLLVEPNPVYARKLREVRPGDEVLEAGIGPGEEDTAADYYVFRGDGQLNTFSKEQADSLVARGGADILDHVAKVRLVNVNHALAARFPSGGPDYFSVDTEGFDLVILKSLDFARFRPKVVCAETCTLDGHVDDAIMALMKERGYSPRGGSFVNTVFCDDRLFG
jgi:hypothetical protein